MKNENNNKTIIKKEDLDNFSKDDLSQNQSYFESNHKDFVIDHLLNNGLNWFEYLLKKSLINDNILNTKIIENNNEFIDQIENNSTAPKNRWFNSIMSFLLASIFVLIGVIIVCLIVIFT